MSFTYTFITPQVNRSQFYFELSKEPIFAKIIDRNEKGIIIKAARLLATPGGLTDEVLVYSAPGLLDPDEVFAFSIPTDTKGIFSVIQFDFPAIYTKTIQKITMFQ